MSPQRHAPKSPWGKQRYLRTETAQDRRNVVAETVYWGQAETCQPAVRMVQQYGWCRAGFMQGRCGFPGVEDSMCSDVLMAVESPATHAVKRLRLVARGWRAALGLWVVQHLRVGVCFYSCVHAAVGGGRQAWGPACRARV